MSLLHEESRIELVTRWLVWLGVTHAVYNVDNTHQCFNEKPRAIIRPFKEVNNFYGCLKCGKYHFCFHSHHTCDSVAPTQDINNNMPTCVYSGQSILDAQNEVVGNYVDIVALNSDIQNHVYLSTTIGGMGLNTTSSSPTATMDARRLASYESLVNANSLHNKKTRSPNKRERRRIEKQDMTTRYLRHGIVTPLGHEDDDEGDEEDETQIPHTIGEVMLSNKRLDHEADVTILDEIMAGGDDDVEDYGCDVEDAGGGGGNGCNKEDWIEEEDTAAYDNRLTRMKNPHNNVVFWDNYYAFLIQGDEPLLVAPLPEIGPPCDELPVKQQQRQTDSVFRFDDTRWNNVVRETIEDEIRRIIDMLLRVSVVRDQKTIPPREYTSLLERLVAYYNNIVCNIAVLVYHSSHIEKMALEKYETNDKQNRSSHSNKVSVKVTDISSLIEEAGDGDEGTTTRELPYHRVIELVCPKKICAALMLHLFTDDFRLCDSMTNSICIWTKDPWLSHMKREGFDEIIGNGSGSGLFNRREIGVTATIVNEALMTYSRQPMWLSSVVHNMKCR